MAAKRKKQLSYANVKKEDKKFDAQLDVVVGDYTFKVDKLFRDSKMMDMISELTVNLEDSNSTGINLNDMFMPYALLLIIKHFTNIDVPQAVNEQVAFLTMLIDQELISPIIDSLPEEELQKVFLKIKEVAERKEEILNEILAEVERLENENKKKELASQGYEFVLSEDSESDS